MLPPLLFALMGNAGCNLSTWCEAVGREAVPTNRPDGCEIVMSRKNIFTPLREEESVHDGICRLGMYGNRTTFLSSGGHDWW